jgi:glyoxylase-like metal-dependent hydrolase (beta-lactamase superfamily II)
MSDLLLAAHTTVVVGASNGKYPDGNSVVVRGSEGVLLIDPSLTVHGRADLHGTVDHALVSHAHEDHVAGLGALAARQVHVHRDDLIGVQSLDGLMEVYGLPADVEAGWREVVCESFHYQGVPSASGFADGQTFDAGDVRVEVMPLPGHTRGHSAFVIEPDGVAFVGDIDLSSFGPYYGDHWSDLDDFVASMVRVRDLDARHYVTFHHKGVVDGRAEFVRLLDEFAAVIERRSDRLLALLDQPRTLDDLVVDGIVYRVGTRPDHFGHSVERRTISMHLDALQRQGVVRIEGAQFSRC